MYTEKKVIEAYLQTFKKLRRFVDHRYYELRFKQKKEKRKLKQKILFYINLHLLLEYTLLRILDVSTTIVGIRMPGKQILNPIMAQMYENNIPLIFLFNVILVLIFLVVALFAYKNEKYIAIAIMLCACFSVYNKLNYFTVVNNFRVLFS